MSINVLKYINNGFRDTGAIFGHVRLPVIHVSRRRSFMQKECSAKYKRSYRQHGFTLLELLVALVIVAISLIGIMLLQKSILDGAVDNSQRSIGVFKSHEIIDRMRANMDGVSFYEAALENLTPNSCNTPQGFNCNANNCTPQQVASRDAYEVFCGSGGGAAGQKFINVSSMRIQCTGPCQQESPAVLEIQWQVTGNINETINDAPEKAGPKTNSLTIDVIL